MHELRHDGGVVRFGVFEVDLCARELRRHGRRIHIQDKPFELLAVLLEGPGEIVTREALRQRLWPADTFVVFDDSVNTAVRKVREALGESADHPQFIETVPRHGYRFIGVVDGNGSGTTLVDTHPPATAIEPEVDRGRALPVAITTLAAAAVIASVWLAFRPRDVGADVVRFHLQPPEAASYPAGAPRVAVSPDGRRAAFVAVSRPRLERRVWMQSLDSAVARPIPGTENAWDPFWSPDGRSIAFVSYGVLRRFDLDSGTATPLTGAVADSSGAWSASSGMLVPGAGRGLVHVNPATGASEPVTVLDAAREETGHLFPQFLPDGRFLYLAKSRRPDLTGVYIGRIGDSRTTRILDSCCKAAYAEPGILLFMRARRLVAQRFALDTTRLQGEPAEIAAGLASYETTGGAGFALSAAGPLVYASPPRLPKRELVWLNETGQRMAAVGAAEYDRSVQLSPDGGWAVVERPDLESDTSASDVWLLDLARGIRSRLTTSPANDEGPIWSPDSRRFVYARHRGIHEIADLYVKDRSLPEEDRPLLVDDTGSKHPSDWSADGRLVLYHMEDASGKRNIWVLPLTGERRPVPWLATPADEWRARFSPNGRWIAYESDETGRAEIFVRALDRPATKWQISAAGGTQPRWRADGGELYYVSADYQMIAVPVRANGTFAADRPQPRFELRRLASIPPTQTPYDVSADGRRFLVGAVVDEGGDAPMTVLLNWRRLLERR